MPKIPVHGLTIKANGILRQITSEVSISQVSDPSLKPTEQPPCTKFKAIWDTGATSTVITEPVVSECSLRPTGMAKVETASDTVNAETYIVNITLPSGVRFNNLKVTKGRIKGADVLIGMDIITTGDFAISNFQGKTTVAFRIPSVECIDWNPNLKKTAPPVMHTKVGRNEPCPCGSGKKYKRCCGK